MSQAEALIAVDEPQEVSVLWRVRQVLAWGVHSYTALGLVAAAGMAVLIVRGDALSFAWAFALMFVATVVDATDGMLARAVRVKEVLPRFDGSQLDNQIDFLTYTALPLLLLWRAEVLPESLGWCLLVPLLASVYGFCQTNAKTADGFFIGFPSYWNIVAFYLYLLMPPVWFSVGVLWLLAALTFVPSRYLYPSKGYGWINVVATVTGAVWGGLLIWILAEMLIGPERPPRWLVLVSLLYPAFYLAASWVVSMRRQHAESPNDPLRGGD